MENLSGKKFSRLLVISFSNKNKNRYFWNCLCDCGKKTIVRGDGLKGGKTRSCGCLNIEQLHSKKNISKLIIAATVHGFSHSAHGKKFYKAWTSMRERCLKKNKTHFKRYFLRKIKVCSRWEVFENFKKDLYKSYLDHVEKFGEKETTLDRINNNKGYFKKNCRWATHKEQSNNRENSKI